METEPAGAVCSICLESGGDVFLDCCLKGCVAVFHGPCSSRVLPSAKCPVCRRDVDETLGSVEAFFRLRSYSSERYSALESELDRSERLCAYLLLSWARDIFRRKPWLLCPCRRR